jgi:hypothetical protein
VQVDVRLDEVVIHALEKEPQLRYQQVTEVRNDVTEITEGPARPRRRKWLRALAAVAGVFAVGLLAVTTLEVIDDGSGQVTGKVWGLPAPADHELYLVPRLPGQATPPREARLEIRPNADGSFDFGRVEPGRYFAGMGNDSGQWYRSLEVRAGETTHVDFNAAGSVPVRARVLSAGHPLANETVALFDLRPPHDVARATTDGAGMLEVLLPRTGTYEASIDLVEGSVIGRSWLQIEATDEGVDLVELDFPATRVVGAITDLAGEPLTDARAWVFQPLHGASRLGPNHAISVESGRFEVLGGGTDALWIHIEAEGYGHRNVGPLDLSRSLGTLELEPIALSRENGIRVAVQDPSGRELRDATVMVFQPVEHEAVAWGSAGKTDHDGAALIGGLNTGRHSVLARAPGFAPGRLDGVDVPVADPSRPTVVRLQRGGNVRIEVRNADGAPLAQAVPELLDENGNRVLQLVTGEFPSPHPFWTDTEGRIELADVTPGTYRVHLRGPLQTEPTTVEVESGAETRVVLQLNETESL